MDICAVDGCNLPERARGWCRGHYMRWWRYGHPNYDQARKDMDRWRAQIEFTDTCWNWHGTINARGYGVINDNGKNALAHRWGYEALIGPIPEGLQLDHLCMVTNCVNPAHLEPVTNAENHRRAAASHTHCRHGHEWTPENEYWPPCGAGRECRACIKRRSAARQGNGWARQRARQQASQLEQPAPLAQSSRAASSC